MPSKYSRYDPHKIYVRKVRKLQSKGLLGDVDLRRKAQPHVLRSFEKYSDVLSGKATAVRVPTRGKARALRQELGARGRGDVVVVPKESKTERISYSRKSGHIISRRPGYQEGETIKKTYGEKFKARPKNAKAYYVLPERRRGLGKIKRKVFSSFDEMLYYLSKYEINFDDIEDTIEIEEVERHGAADEKFKERIARDRAAYYKRKGKRARHARKSRR